MNLDRLIKELKKAAYSEIGDRAATDSINSDIIEIVSVRIADLQMYMFNNDIGVSVVDEATNGSGASQKACRALLRLLESKVTEVNVHSNRFVQLLGVLETAGTIRNADNEGVKALANKTTTRARQIMKQKVRHGWVISARAVIAEGE